MESINPTLEREGCRNSSSLWAGEPPTFQSCRACSSWWKVLKGSVLSTAGCWEERGRCALTAREELCQEGIRGEDCCRRLGLLSWLRPVNQIAKDNHKPQHILRRWEETQGRVLTGLQIVETYFKVFVRPVGLRPSGTGGPEVPFPYTTSEAAATDSYYEVALLPQTLTAEGGGSPHSQRYMIKYLGQHPHQWPFIWGATILACPVGNTLGSISKSARSPQLPLTSLKLCVLSSCKMRSTVFQISQPEREAP